MSGLNLGETMGATLIGVIVAAVLYGCACVQVLYYFARYSNDRWPLKLLVTVVWVIETTHQAVISHTAYTYLITNYSNPAILSTLLWCTVVQVFFNGLTALLAQSYFTLRIWKLSEKNMLLLAPVSLLILGGFGCVAAYSLLAIGLHTYEQLESLRPLLMVVNALATAVDVLIAGVLCIMLHMARTGFRRSDGLINKLIIFTVNTGLLTSICAVFSLITIVVEPNAFIYIAFYFALGRLYSNSFLATLNARKALRSRASNNELLSLSIRDIQRAEPFENHRKVDSRFSFIVGMGEDPVLSSSDVAASLPSSSELLTSFHPSVKFDTSSKYMA